MGTWQRNDRGCQLCVCVCVVCMRLTVGVCLLVYAERNL